MGELPGEAEGICIGRKVGVGGDEGAPAARNPLNDLESQMSKAGSASWLNTRASAWPNSQRHLVRCQAFLKMSTY